ncbi:bifunctional chorismate mutase/prephenate dehydrogenase [endosymbiont of Pachyrhynchus infernalis]|uniref:bifunctional chorismate mutase/prephenate dehydrogenase n=1 Tax=endosymbiont of Pachyrhynchus infernalis TaxID=1971488 RepID=UPI000DC73077|nr:bifunctional chorismate mutase/prephenate dehydrogenase [endosymbiont of Pachyrhynchus infernalis]BBA84878.1 t-protein [endosymbiont of Pachyrhynchus infernalis]
MNNKFEFDLKDLRNKIDNIDEKIFNLINERLKIVENIGIIKNKNNISCYVSKREEFILNKLNKKYNKYISYFTISSVIKKIMYESYIKEIYCNNNISNNNNSIKIIFIGGKGKMGSIFKNLFIKYNYNVSEINSKDWENKEEKLLNSNLVFICSPISKLNFVLENIYKYITSECILLDISSIKEKSINKMLNIHSGPVLGLHPMFGPNIRSITKQIIIYSNGRYPEKYKWILNQFKLWGVFIYNLDSNKHDNYMLHIQSLRYINLFMLGSFIMNKNLNIKEIFKISPPIYKIYLSILCKFFSGDINLYLDIIYSSNKSLNLFDEYINYTKNIYNIFSSNKKRNNIINIFENIKSWLNKKNIKELSDINDTLSEEIIINNF